MALIERHSDERGLSVIELIAVLCIVAITMGSVVSTLAVVNDPLADGVNETVVFLRLARARAIATTSALLVTPNSSTTLGVSQVPACDNQEDANPTGDTLVLPRTVSFVETDWAVCFTSRGLANISESFMLASDDNRRGNQERRRTIEIALGGGVRVSE